MSKLTGNTRLRVGNFGKLILQVEVEYKTVDPYFFDVGTSRDWRDAKLEDISDDFLSQAKLKIK